MSTRFFIINGQALVTAGKIATLHIDIINWFTFSDSKIGAKIWKAVASVETEFTKEWNLLEVHDHEL